MSTREGLSDIGRQQSDDSHGIGGNIPNWKERIDISIAKSRKIRGSNYVQLSTIDYETMEPRCRTVVFRGFMKGLPFAAVKDVLMGGADGSTEVKESGADDGGNENPSCDYVMKMITDLRSHKVRELEVFHESLKGNGEVGKKNVNANTAEMVWWFPKSSEQYRISGRLQYIGNDGPLYSYNDAKEIGQNNDYFLAQRKQQWGNLSDMAREQFYWENPGIPYTTTWEEGNGIPPGGRDEDGKVLPPPETFLIALLYPKKIDYLRLGDNYRQVDEWGKRVEDSGDENGWISERVNP